MNFLSPNANIFSSGTEIGNETSQNPRIGTRKRQKLWYRKFQDVSAPAVPEEEEEEEEGLYLRTGTRKRVQTNEAKSRRRRRREEEEEEERLRTLWRNQQSFQN